MKTGKDRQRDWVKRLHQGDQVTWNDPDIDLCTRVYNIANIEHLSDYVVRIVDKDGSVLECFIDELS